MMFPHPGLAAFPHVQRTKHKRHAIACRLFATLFSQSYFLAYQSELVAEKAFHLSGKSSSAKIAVTGQTGTQAPQSMHSVGLMYSWVTLSCSASSFLGWMQSTGQTSTHAVSLVPIHGSAI